MESIKIRKLAQEESKDLDKMTHIANLVNKVYKIAEDGLYKKQSLRTTPENVQQLTLNHEIAVAELYNKIIGSIRINQHNNEVGGFGMIAVDDAYQGKGIGRKLISFAESQCLEENFQMMQLELLVPAEGKHPYKKALEKWYIRLGYEPSHKDSIDSVFPELREKLAMPCQFIVFQKDLTKQVFEV